MAACVFTGPGIGTGIGRLYHRVFLEVLSGARVMKLWERWRCMAPPVTARHGSYCSA
jgi:hypothetical protein